MERSTWYVSDKTAFGLCSSNPPSRTLATVLGRISTSRTECRQIETGRGRGSERENWKGDSDKREMRRARELGRGREERERETDEGKRDTHGQMEPEMELGQRCGQKRSNTTYTTATSREHNERRDEEMEKAEESTARIQPPNLRPHPTRPSLPHHISRQLFCIGQRKRE